MELKTLLADIASAIREKDGSEGEITASAFPERIRAIRSGVELESIQITTPPARTEYIAGEGFDPAGMVVTAVYSNGARLDVTGYSVEPAGALTEDTESVTIRYTEGGRSAETAVAVHVVYVTVYGAEWAGTSSTKLTRTDAAAGFQDPSPAVGNGTGSSPFDNILPWSGMKRVKDSQVGELVEIPKFYYKLTQNDRKLKIQIAGEPAPGFSVSPAHMDRGDGKGERSVVYIARYHCVTSTYKSETNKLPASNMRQDTARTAIHELGANIWQSDFAMRLTIWLLYLVEFADWESQGCIGYGCSANGSLENNGKTDQMKYHTGTTTEDRTTYGYVQYRWIEGLWDNVFDWLDGCNYDSRGFNIILNPADFGDTGGVCVGKPASGSASAMTVSTAADFPMFYPVEGKGSISTYATDCWYYEESCPCLYVGGSYVQRQTYGLFFVIYNSSTSSRSVGCRLMKLP
ncbi:MAG: bacterial Ig-like domain-containing protein [Oscillospiraceae bacterium]|jgi:hypothetical protein